MLIAYLLACLVLVTAVVVLVLMRLTRRVARRAQAAIPPDGKFLEIDGERLHYVDFGHGPAVVFIHGLCGQLRNFAYLPLDALARTHRVILVDRPGSGYSIRSQPDDAAIATQAGVVAQLIDRLSLDRPLVVGHSLGGAIALALALDHPERVGALALIAPLTQPVHDVPGPFRALAIRSAWWRRCVAHTLAVPMGMLTGRATLAHVFAPEDPPGDFLIRGGGVLGFRPGNFEASSGDLLAAERDMPGLAADMKKLGVRPGIWMRPTALMTVDNPKRLRAGPCTAPEKPLDLTLPENLRLIRDDVARVHGWGYDLIKHDFSSYDIFARWGFDFGAELTDPGWSFADRSLTNAEIILRLYRTLREGAGNAVLLGCNTIGHLAAGMVDIQRIGDDTSASDWDSTRRMGVNTLAFRGAHQNTFYAADADCVPVSPRVPARLSRQWLDLVARSGTPLFLSIDPAACDAEMAGSSIGVPLEAERSLVSATAHSGVAPGTGVPCPAPKSPARSAVVSRGPACGSRATAPSRSITKRARSVSTSEGARRSTASRARAISSALG